MFNVNVYSIHPAAPRTIINNLSKCKTVEMFYWVSSEIRDMAIRERWQSRKFLVQHLVSGCAAMSELSIKFVLAGFEINANKIEKLRKTFNLMLAHIKSH